MIDHTAYAKRVETGWIGVYTYPKDGAAHTEQVRRLGVICIYRSEVAAKAAAGIALCRALNAAMNPRRRGKVFAVRNTGGRARVFAEAERVFRGTAPQ